MPDEDKSIAQVVPRVTDKYSDPRKAIAYKMWSENPEISNNEIANEFGVSVRTIFRWIEDIRESQKITPETQTEIKEVKDSLYLISDGEYQKIGVSRDVKRRLKDLQTSNARKLFIVLEYLPSNTSARNIEHSVHEHLKDKRLEGEWFSSSLSDAEFYDLCLGFDRE